MFDVTLTLRMQSKQFHVLAVRCPKLRLVFGGLLAAGPPCSLFVASCQSVHGRFRSRPHA